MKVSKITSSSAAPAVVAEALAEDAPAIPGAHYRKGLDFVRREGAMFFSRAGDASVSEKNQRRRRVRTPGA